MVVLIPPMGHTDAFYFPLLEELQQQKQDLKLKVLSYPAQHSNQNVLEYLARYFSSQIKEDCLLVGLSLGATLSFRINEINPHIKRIIAMATGGIKVARARKNMILHASKIMSPKELIEKSLGIEDDQFLEHFCRNHEQALKYLETLKSRWRQSDRYSYFIDQIKAAVEVDYELALQNAQEKSIIVWGGQDKVFSLRHLRKIEKLMPRTEIKLFDELGHYLPLESPEEIARIILQYEISTF